MTTRLRAQPAIYFTVLLLALTALQFSSCEKDEDVPAFATLDLTTLPIVFVMEEEQAAMATGTGTGSSDNSGRSNTDNCCPSIQIINEAYAADLRIARPEDAFIDNPFGMEITTDPADPIVIELRAPSGGNLGPYSLEVAQGEGIAINASKLDAGEYLLTISVSGKSASASFVVKP